MNRNTGMFAGQIIGTMSGLQVVGLDIAKHVFQLPTVDMGTGEIVNVQIKRAKVVIVAQAAKMARTIWAVTAKQQDFQRGFKSVRPLAA